MTLNARSIFEYMKNEAERPFLLAAFEGKLDDAKRVAYAEVLDSRDPVRAEWLRLEMKLQGAATQDIEEHKRYHELSRRVGYDFFRVFRRNDILNCGGAAKDPRRIRFAFICEKQWETLLPTENEAERHCSACNSRVYHCSTVKEAEVRALAGHCIAVSHALVEKAAGGGYRNAVGRPDPVGDWSQNLFPDE
jgi:hypothetical protein